MNNKAIIAVIDAILSERLENVQTMKGPRGLKGRPGKDFILDDHLEPVSEILQTLVSEGDFKLKYSDLTAEDKVELKLKFEDLSTEDLEQLIGPRGPRGKDGKGFNFYECKDDIEDSLKKELPKLKLKFEDLSQEDKEELTLKYGHLTDEQKQSLKGEKGFRGQRGKMGEQGPQGLQGIEGEKGEVGDQGIQGEKGEKGFRGQRGKIGEQGIQGLQGEVGPQGEVGDMGPKGAPGLTGRDGRSGEAGKDAPYIIDVEVEQLSKNEIGFRFEFSDGSIIETGSVEIPSITQLAYSMMASTGGGGGGSISVTDGVTTVDPATGIDFTGATVVDNAGVAEVTIDTQNTSITDGVTTLDTQDICFDGATVTDNGGGQVKVTIDDQPGDCLEIADEGNNVTTCAKAINFIGETVQAYNSTVIADWPTLDVIDSIGSWEATPGGLVTVEIKPQATSLQKTYVTGEDISALDVVRLDASELLFKATSDTVYSDSKAIGVSLTGATTGNDASVLMFGILEDNIFSYTPNEPLFVGLNGVITDTPPSQPTDNFSTQIGHGLGAGSIFVNIREPIGL